MRLSVSSRMGRPNGLPVFQILDKYGGIPFIFVAPVQLVPSNHSHRMRTRSAALSHGPLHARLCALRSDTPCTGSSGCPCSDSHSDHLCCPVSCASCDGLPRLAFHTWYTGSSLSLRQTALPVPRLLNCKRILQSLVPCLIPKRPAITAGPIGVNEHKCSLKKLNLWQREGDGSSTISQLNVNIML